MNVLFDGQIFARQKYGGISRYFYELIKGLAQSSGVDVSVILGECKSSFQFGSLNLRHHLRIPRLPYWRVRKMVKEIEERIVSRWHNSDPFDIYHRTYYENRWCAPFSSGKRSPVRIITVFDLIHEQFPEYIAEIDRNIDEKIESIKSAQAILAISEQTRADLVRLYSIPAERVKVTYLAPTLCPEGLEPVRRQRPFILHVGKRSGYKNFNGLLSAYAVSSRLKKEFDLVCFGWLPFQPPELEDFRLAGVVDRVYHVRGDDTELTRYYMGASLFVCPSLYEGFGLTPLEAMTCGCPVVSGTGGSLGEVVGDAVEVCDPSRPEALGNTMEYVLSDTARKEELVRRGKIHAKKFSWDRCVKDTLSLYRSVHSGGSGFAA
ncbi:MAG: glycosyltransferase family 4 protein [Spirochaetales bacterium]|nr:glycosyltransferase family 4 protein [Spirochaetales bacterium]